jgi:hypothetical protein
MDRLIDLRDTPYLTSRGEFSDEEDEKAFGGEWKLFQQKVLMLRHNSPNYCLVKFECYDLSENQCSRIGKYLWSSTHMKNIILSRCMLTDSKMKKLFGNIAQQNGTNEYLVTHRILENLLKENGLVDKILGSVISFKNITNINVSHNQFGIDGLEDLVKASAGCPITSLDISHCNFNSISPLKGLKKCTMLKKLNIRGNMLGIADSDIIALLLGSGYPALRELDLDDCGINDDMIDVICPVLTSNKTLRYFYLTGMKNVIGVRGTSALCNAVNDTSSFKKILESNHFIWKITTKNPGALWEVCYPNLCNSYLGPNGIAVKKYMDHIATSESFDTSPFTETNTTLIPHIFARFNSVGRVRVRDETFVCTALYKIMSNKAVRERIETAKTLTDLQNDNAKLSASNKRLHDENTKLKQQLAELMAKFHGSKRNEITSAGSIAERVKRKRAHCK